MTDDSTSPRRSREDVHALVAAMAPRPPAEVTDDTELIADLAYDSLRLIELSIALERLFELSTLDESSVATVSTVGGVVALVSDHRGAA